MRMTPKEIVLDAATGTRLIEIRHEMPRGLTVLRYRLTRPGEIGACEFTTLRRARAAFQARVTEARHGVPAGTPGE